ncbi:hypothetical protein [Pandoraea commovens]|nr:hypothetical protein [Pandoraea commovens]
MNATRIALHGDGARDHCAAFFFLGNRFSFRTSPMPNFRGSLIFGGHVRSQNVRFFDDFAATRDMAQ